jgi:thioredoxin 1
MEELTSKQIKDKINNGETFLVDLYATWCGPCQVMLNNLSIINENQYGSKFNIYKFNVESDREFAVDFFKIRSVPTVKIYKEGKEVFSKSGVMAVSEVINEMLKY